jgi:hypothetical protein
LVVVVSPLGSVVLLVLVALCVVSVLPEVELPAWASVPDCDWASLCDIALLSLFIESLLVLCAASLLVAVELCASAGLAGVVAWDISCGVAVLFSAFGVVLSDCGVALLSGVVVVVVVEFVVVPLVPFAAGLAHGSFAWVELLFDGVAAVPVAFMVESLCGVVAPVVLLGIALSCVLEGIAGVVVVLCVLFVVVL